MALIAVSAGLLIAQAPPDRPTRRGRVNQELMASYLGLTDDQKVKMKSIRESARESAKPIREQLRQVRTDLNAAIEAGKPVSELAASEGNLMGQLVALRANTRVQMRALLTPEQLAKQQALRAKIRAGRRAAAVK
jgi:Spy/CpxP family protein refolding chaperone